MSDEHQRWKSYFYPGANVLRNKLGLTNADELSAVEYATTLQAEDELLHEDQPITGDTVSDRLRFIHRHLFGEIYEWAGELRDVNMSKGGHHFGDYNSMGMYLRQANGMVQRFDWERASYDDKLTHLAEIHTHLNFAHPFREGNGRSTKVFMTDLARQHGVKIRFAAVDAEAWNAASKKTFLDPDGLRQDSQPMLDVYKQIAAPIKTEPDTAQAAPPGYSVMVNPHASADKGQGFTSDLTPTTDNSIGRDTDAGLGD